MTFVLTNWSVRSPALPILLYVVLDNFLYFRILLSFGFPLLLGGFQLREWVSILFQGIVRWWVVGLPRRGPSVLIYAHLPLSEFCKFVNQSINQ